MGLKDRNSKNPMEVEEIKKWQEDTELYKKDLNDPDKQDGGYLEPESLDVKSSGP